jgi:anti-sigma-K factor RskA
MEQQRIHELSAAYALHALASDEERVFEDHLAHCEECRGHVSAFQETAALMAYDVQAPAPPVALKERILAETRAQGPNIVSLAERRRWLFPATAGIAAAAAVTALAFGIWAFSLSSNLADERSANDRSEQVVSVLAQSDTKRIPLDGADGALVVDASGQGWLVLFGLEAAPSDKTYEAWIVEGGATRAAGLFHGGESRTVVRLVQKVPEGALVAVTLERAGGVARPQNKPVFTSAQTA